jgi:hypothetical protein
MLIHVKIITTNLLHVNVGNSPPQPSNQLENYFPGWLQTTILLISASQVARITGVSREPLVPGRNILE